MLTSLKNSQSKCDTSLLEMAGYASGKGRPDYCVFVTENIRSGPVLRKDHGDVGSSKVFGHLIHTVSI